MTTPDPPADDTDIPPDVAELLQEQDTAALQQIIGYIRGLLRDRQEHQLDAIEAGPGEEIVRVTEQDGYTEVVKREPCAENCSDCPHGPYLYHVQSEERPDGEHRLHWTFIGQVRE